MQATTHDTQQGEPGGTAGGLPTFADVARATVLGLRVHVTGLEPPAVEEQIAALGEEFLPVMPELLPPGPNGAAIAADQAKAK